MFSAPADHQGDPQAPPPPLATGEGGEVGGGGDTWQI